MTAGRRGGENAHRAVRQPKSRLLLVVMIVGVLYVLLPLFWLVVNATKSEAALFTSFGLWFGHSNSLWDNLSQVFTYHDGIYRRWLLNTFLYVIAGAGGATAIAALGGYALAVFDFRGRNVVLAVVIAGIAVPGTALAIPTFLLFSKLGITNTPWSVIVPSLVSPFGLYLIWVYAREAIPMSLLESARLDGAGEFRIFFTIAVPLLSPGLVTVLLFSVVATWNNYFLPLIMLSNPKWYPLTVGLNQWNAQAATVGGQPIYNLVITGSLVAIIPIVVMFLFLQRFWQSGLAAGSVKQ